MRAVYYHTHIGGITQHNSYHNSTAGGQVQTRIRREYAQNASRLRVCKGTTMHNVLLIWQTHRPCHTTPRCLEDWLVVSAREGRCGRREASPAQSDPRVSLRITILRAVCICHSLRPARLSRVPAHHSCRRAERRLLTSGCVSGRAGLVRHSRLRQPPRPSSQAAAERSRAEPAAGAVQSFLRAALFAGPRHETPP